MKFITLDPDRPSAEYIDDVLHIRASALGECPKALALLAAGESRGPFPSSSTQSI